MAPGAFQQKSMSQEAKQHTIGSPSWTRPGIVPLAVDCAVATFMASTIVRHVRIRSKYDYVAGRDCSACSHETYSAALLAPGLGRLSQPDAFYLQGLLDIHCATDVVHSCPSSNG